MEKPQTFTGELYVPKFIHVEVRKSVAMKGACCYMSVALLVLLQCCKNDSLSPGNFYIMQENKFSLMMNVLLLISRLWEVIKEGGS